MAMVINHNIPALQTYNTVNRTNSALEKSIQKLSTGLRINSAADDAAGLAISEKMRSQINGMDRAVSNAQDGISMIQTAEGALNETHSILQRMRELSVQAANDTLTSQDRGYIQMEIDELREEVTRIGNTTQFNKKKLLNGDAAVLWSSDRLSTKAVVNGGLRSLDQFGQKVVAEGNYEITVKSKPGQAEIQKSDIFKIKHDGVLMNLVTNKEQGVEGLTVDTGTPSGIYNIQTDAAPTGGTTLADNVTGTYGFDPIKLGSQKLTGKTGIVAGDGTTKTQAAYYGAKDLSFSIGDEIATIKLATGTGGVTSTTDGAGLAGLIKTALQGKGGVWADVTVTAGTGNVMVIEKPEGTSGALSTQTIKAANDLAKELMGTSDPSIFTAGNNTLDISQQIDITGSNAEQNANVLFEVIDVNTANKSITLKASGKFMDADGNISSDTAEIMITEGGTAADGAVFKTQLGDTGLQFQLKAGMTPTINKGSKIVVNVAGKGGTSNAADVAVVVKGTANDDWEESWGSITDKDVKYGLKGDNVKNKDLHFQNFYLNSKNGKVYEGDIILSTNSTKLDNTPANTPLASFEKGFVGQVAKGDVKLRDLDKFWTSEGVFMLDDAKTITVNQGDGKQASVTLYANDTLEDVANKLNDAIATGLGQAQYVDNAANFVNFVTTATKEGSESVAGTFLVRSVIPGSDGTITFSGDENVLNAFSLNVLQKGVESDYTVGIKDAHSGKTVVADTNVTGNRLLGVLHPNIDVEFDPLTGVSATWNESKKAYVYKEPMEEKTILHLSDNTTVFQVGANEGEDMGVHIGDMRATALGLDSVNVTNRESAARSITILDNAIDKVSTQRAKLGAYQNRLEHTVNNLNTASENITAAESRIRDTDMAKEMMNFTKLQIMLQAGTSMLAQANQLPQNVMALVR